MTIRASALELIPDLPQKNLLAMLLQDLWQDQDIVAIWLGGSLARGVGDIYSDVDLRLAIWPRAFDAQQLPAAAQRLNAAAVGCHQVIFGHDAALFHMLLEDGSFYDLLIQTSEREPAEETRIVLACRDEVFERKLATGSDPTVDFPTADPATIQHVIVTFWMSQQKHLRVLHRQLPLMSWEGEHRMRQDVIRLWYVLATGCDCGPVAGLTIHTFTPVARALREQRPGAGLELLGVSLRSPAEIIAAAGQLREEAAHVGRLLAERLGFVYPEALEQTVRRSWDAFLAEGEARQRRG